MIYLVRFCTVQYKKNGFRGLAFAAQQFFFAVSTGKSTDDVTSRLPRKACYDGARSSTFTRQYLADRRGYLTGGLTKIIVETQIPIWAET